MEIEKVIIIAYLCVVASGVAVSGIYIIFDFCHDWIIRKLIEKYKGHKNDKQERDTSK